MKKCGICLLALTLAVLLAAPAMAASITPYASMRLGTFWSHTDYNADTPVVAGDDDDSDLNIDLADISRFGAKGQVGDISGRVELGLRHSSNAAGYDTTNAATGTAKPHYNRHVYTRLLYGTYKMNGATLLVGQNYTPPTFPSAQQGPGIFNLQNGNIGTGCLWDRRWPQIRVTLDNGFYVVAAEAYAGTGVTGGAVPPSGAAVGGDYDVTIPKLFVGWDFKREGLYLGPGFGYNTFNLNDGAGFDETISSWIAFLKGKVNLGTVDLQFAAHYGSNLNDFGILGRGTSRAVVVAGSVENSKSYGGYLQASFKVDPATINVGWGYVNDENEDGGDAQENDKMSYFVNCKIPIADTFFVVPEVNFVDGMDDTAGTEDADKWNVGMLWQMDF